MSRRHRRDVLAQLAAAGGGLEWETTAGLGIRFAGCRSRIDFASLAAILAHAVWLDLSDANVHDHEVLGLPPLPALESISLARTFVSAKGAETLVRCCPGLISLTISKGMLDASDLARLRHEFINVMILERF